MIKRTGEHVLTWIGVGLSALGVLLAGLILPFMNTPEFIQGMQEGNPEITAENAASSVSFLQVLLTVGLIVGIITLILAVVGGIFISKKAKTAGILLLIAGIISILGNWIVAILWIIAGIMLLVRKPKNETLTEDGYYNYDKANQVAEERSEEDPYKY